MSAAAQQYSTSYAGGRTGGSPQRGPRRRLAWQTIFAAIGTITMGVALLAVTLGIPAKMGYNLNGAGELNENHSWDMLKMSQSIDKNLKYVDEHTDAEDGHYVGILQSINKSEDAIPELAVAVGDMMTGVTAIDEGLASVNATTMKMREDMAAMGSTSSHSAATMSALNGDIGDLSNSMAALLVATQGLVVNMTAIEGKARFIANKDTSVALKGAKELNRALPPSVPAPTLDGPANGGGGAE